MERIPHSKYEQLEMENEQLKVQVQDLQDRLAAEHDVDMSVSIDEYPSMKADMEQLKQIHVCSVKKPTAPSTVLV